MRRHDEDDSDVVFEKGTPLAEYLEENGLSNWGIEEPSNASTNASNNKRTIRGLGPIPLILTADRGKAKLRRDRFRGLLNQAVKATISEQETGEFLERFRYILVSSDLLDDRGHHYYYQQDISGKGTRCEASINKASQDHRRKRILHGDDGPWTIMKQQRHWVGGGGCIVVLATLLTWGIRNGRIRGNNSVAAIVVILCIVLFLFSHSRRRRLRLLRAKAVSYASQFIQSNQEFDVAVGKCVNFIMQVELLSRGYYLNGQNKSANLDSKTLGKHIRGSVSAGFYLAMNAYMDAINELTEHVNQLDLERYLDMYDLSPGEISELGWKINEQHHSNSYYGASGSNASVQSLKQEFNKLHTLRRALMCVLLSIPSTGKCSSEEISSWTASIDHIQSISNLVTELSKTITKDNLSPPCIVPESNNNESDNTNTNTGNVARKHTRSLNQLVGSIQNLNAHLELLSESTDDDTMYYRSFQSMGTEVQLLLEAWERGFKNLEEPIVNESPSPKEEDSEINTLVEDFPTSPRISEPMDSPRMSMHSRTDSNMTRLSMHSRTDSNATTLFQAVVEEEDKMPPPPPTNNNNLSRAERIKMMHQAEHNKKSAASTRRNFVVELDNVLTRRKQQQS